MTARVDTPHFQGEVLAVGLQDCSPLAGPHGLAGVEFWDVTQPDAPVMLSYYPVGSVHGVHELFITARDGHAYALLAVPYSEVYDGRGDVRIVDITDPRLPVEVADWGIGKDLGLAFGSPGLTTLGPPYDCTPPAGTPDYCRGSLPYVYGHSVSADETGQVAYVSYWDAGWVALDISDPTNPIVLSHSDVSLAADGDLHSTVKVPGRQLLVTTDEDLSPDRFDQPPPGVPGWGFARVWDISSPASPVEIGRMATASSDSNRLGGWHTVHNPFPIGDRVYFSWYSDGIRVFDATNPADSEEIAYYVPPQAFVWGMFVSGDLVFASDINSGLWIFRVPEQ